MQWKLHTQRLTNRRALQIGSTPVLSLATEGKAWIRESG